MFSFLAGLFDDRQLLPHATCLTWRPDLLWLHAVSDGLIAASYYSIPVALLVFAVKRRDLRFKWMFVLFGVFILACGTSHLFNIWTLWVPDWGASGVVKGVTAVASVVTAAALWPLIPRALALPGPREWVSVNQELINEVGERRAAEAQVRELNRELEARVRERTAELQAANGQLAETNRTLRAEIERRTRTEGELRAAKAEAERANLAKSKFLAAASHDLRQPVQSMFLFFAALDEQVRTLKVRDIIEGMQQSLSGLKLLLDALLDASKLDAGIVTPHVGEIPLGPILKRLEAEFHRPAAAKGLRLRSVDTSLKAATDPVLVERVLRNLLDNAVRYTEKGGILLGCRTRGATVRVVVADTGPGIPPEQREAVFEEFYQIGNPERDRAKGLGLGLAIVRRLAHLLGHEVGVTSVPGRGSCFYIDLPLKGHAAKAEPQPVGRPGRPADGLPADEPAAEAVAVLVIDDEALVRKGFATMVRAWGYHPLEADSGDAAVELLRRTGTVPAVVLADYRLRDEETGTEALRKVERLCGGPVPAVIVTGDTAPERIREAKAARVRLLHKPVAAGELKEVIEALVPPG